MNRSKFNGRLIMLAISCILSTTPTLLWGQANPTMHEGVIRLKVKPELVASSNELSITKSSGIALTGVPSLDRLCKQYSATSIQRVFPYSEKFEARHRKHGLHLWYEVKFESLENALKVAAAYASLNEVTHAEPLYTTKLITGKFIPMDNSAGTMSTLPFNDPYLSKQWHYNNTGDYDGLVGSDINLFNAWKVTAGTPNVVVSVHDQGVDYTHEDLAANMWKNMLEFNGQPKVDDDHNGFVDDIYGYNFASNTGSIDKGEHGTHVSGTIAAVNNNGKGVSGVAGGTGIGDGVRIMSCEILGNDGSNIPKSYIYAADNGAMISQNSWGYTTPGYFEQAALDAIDYFIAEAGNFAGSPMKGGVVIFAAGNDNADELTYPAYYKNVVAVSSLGPTSRRAYYSNYGNWVDIASYGGDDSRHSQNQVLSTVPNNGYAYMQGTSMATPHVSGIAALILSKHGSPTFTNQNLLAHLLTGVRDVDSFNPDFAGKLGIGISDAALAVANDNKIAPDQINDLVLAGISQDFATLQWTVPADQDDQKVLSFNIYYSTTPITNVTSANVLTLPNTKPQGEAIEYEVDGLESTTQYYFVVTAVDRWGNASVISNMVNGTTNEGPTIALDKEQIDLALDINNASTVSDNFNVLNNGAGVLKWSAEFRHKNLNLPFNKSKLHYPALQAQSLSVNKINIGKSRAIAKTMGVPIDGGNFEPIQISYYDPNGPMYIIGDEDLTLTNSAAAKFTVKDDAGFNLTQVQTYLNFTGVTGPVIMEIYLGSTLKNATLTYAQEINSYGPVGYWYSIYLDENIYMEKGTDYWIVFHVPSKNKYPLAMGLELQDSYSDNCFYSTDLGNSWTPLANAINDDRWVFIVSAVSDQPTIGQYVSLSPTSSQVLSGASGQVDVDVDGTTLKNGSYSANIVISSNDKEHKMVRLPINLEITNHKPVLQVDDVSEFGSVFVGKEKTIEIPVQNIGYGDFSQVSLNISDPQFELVDYAPWKIAARYEETITFKFKPTQPGDANATVTLSDVNGNTHEFYLNGVGSEPPIINLTPNQFTVSNLKLGNEFTTTMNIQNTGKYPLKYAFSKFADENTLSEFGKGVQKFGYSSDANLDGTGVPAYSFTDISGEPNIISQFNETKFYPVDLGFDFPFYGQNYSRIYITSQGVITFSDQGYLDDAGNVSFGNPSLPPGLIAAASYPFKPSAGGSIHYKHLPGKMIIEYKDVTDDQPYYGKMPATFEIILYDNGNIDIAYDDLSAWDPFLLTYFKVGIEDPTHKDSYRIKDPFSYRLPPVDISLTSKSILRIYNPGYGALKSVTSISGTIPVGGSKAVDMTFTTANLCEGTFSELVTVLSNDPFNNPARAKVDFTITTGGVVQVSVDKDTIDFGTIFRTAVEQTVVAVQNTGTKDVTISVLGFAGTDFTKDLVAPVTLKARETQYITITANTTKTGTFKRSLIIKTNKGNNFAIPVSSVVVPEPIISIDITSIDKQLASGDSSKVQFTVSNTGKSDLEVVTQGTDWLYTPMDVNGANKTYSWITSKDVGGPTYNWIDIRKTGTFLDSLASYTDPKFFWKGIKLPFTFTFYGKNYDTLFIGANGVLSFAKDKKDYPFGVENIPTTDGPYNFIAPMFGNIVPYTFNYPDAGVYYQAYSDKVVVTYNSFRNWWGMGYHSVSFQAILYNNGNIKFQYALGTDDQTSHECVVGFQNEDGSDGMRIAARNSSFLNDKMAIFLQPASKLIVPALSSAKMTAIVDARNLYIGNYAGNLVLRNNSPANPNLQIPATLVVTGDPAALAGPDSIAFGDAMPYLEDDAYGIPTDKTYYQYFDVKNTGKDNAQLSSYAFKNGSQEFALEVQVEDDWNGGYFWTDVSYLWDPIVIAAGSNLTLRAKLLPMGPAHEVVDTLVISNNTQAGDLLIPISATVIMPPVMTLSPDQLTVQADAANHVETKQFIIDNTSGGSALQYSLSLEYLRAKPEVASVSKSNTRKVTTSSSGRVAADQRPVLSETSKTAMALGRSRTAEKASLDTYNRILQYDTLSVAPHKLGFNGSSELWCGIAFKAPNDGYTLSHVITWYVPGDWLNSDLIVEVRGGSENISNTKLLFTQKFNYTISTPDNEGSLVEIPLDEPQLFYPNETFFVVVKYPLAVTHPQGTADLNQSMPNTFTYSAGDGSWSDLTNLQGFSNYAWMIKAAEKTAGNTGWASINGNMTGTVEAGQTQTVDVVFNAGFALDADNYANVNVAGNDPYNKSSKVLLLLHRNQGPAFKDGEMKALSVDENDTLQYAILAKDLEGDSFTYSLDSNYPHVTLVQSGDTARFTFITDFTMAGDHSIVVHATDALGNVSTLTLDVTVNNVNRKPVVIKAIPSKNYFKGEEAERISLEEFISDPDGDALNYISVSSNTAIAQIFASSSEIMISPESAGSGKIKVVATDPSGASDSLSFDVTVSPVAGVEKQHADFNVVAYPNPTSGKLLIHITGEVNRQYSLRVMNMLGVVVSETKSISSSQEETELDLSKLARGIYFVEIADKSGKVIKRIAKD